MRKFVTKSINNNIICQLLANQSGVQEKWSHLSRDFTLSHMNVHISTHRLMLPSYSQSAVHIQYPWFSLTESASQPLHFEIKNNPPKVHKTKLNLPKSHMVMPLSADDSLGQRKVLGDGVYCRAIIRARGAIAQNNARILLIYAMHILQRTAGGSSSLLLSFSFSPWFACRAETLTRARPRRPRY